jgi:AraC-like DNA-binding protein
MTIIYIAADYVDALVKHGKQLGAGESMTEVLTGLVPWPVASVAIQSLTAKDHSIFAGLTFGLTLGITCHGLLGYAAKNAKTALDAILLDEQYLAMRTNAIRFRVVGYQDRVSLFVDSVLSVETPDWQFLHLTVIGSLARMYSDLYPNRILTATFTTPIPVAVTSKYKSPLLTGITWQEEAGVFRVDVQMNVLLSALSSSDETLNNLLVGQCKAATSVAHTLDEAVVMVRNILRNHLADPPSMSQLSQQMNLSERTFKRHLQKSGTSYREILAEVRTEAAIHYLQHTTLNVDEIAFRLGYSSTPTFRNLFRQWTGKTPKEIRLSSNV